MQNCLLAPDRRSLWRQALLISIQREKLLRRQLVHSRDARSGRLGGYNDLHIDACIGGRDVLASQLIIMPSRQKQCKSHTSPLVEGMNLNIGGYQHNGRSSGSESCVYSASEGGQQPRTLALHFCDDRPRVLQLCLADHQP